MCLAPEGNSTPGDPARTLSSGILRSWGCLRLCAAQSISLDFLTVSSALQATNREAKATSS